MEGEWRGAEGYAHARATNGQDILRVAEELRLVGHIGEARLHPLQELASNGVAFC
jgi:hypothetical protein